uniref:Uncharacterized protein n=1 Tax=Leptobrachium leishanense TaxID=445787 RepID=A0A8C5Q4L2_9ANUR
MGKPKKAPHTPAPPEHGGSRQAGTIRPFLTSSPPDLQVGPESKMAAATCTSAPGSPARSGSEGITPPDLRQLLQALPTREDLTAATTDLRASLLTELRALRTDISGLQTRLHKAEVTQEQQHTVLTAHSTTLDTQQSALQMMARHLEDVENRGRRNNIRIRGLPELETSHRDLHHALTGLFNLILNRDSEIEIEFERFHRALRPKGPPDAPPRDVVCCLLRHSLKESIMAAARGSREIDFAGAKVSLFQDLSPATLQSRRLLRPLTTALQELRLPYKWLFPFGIQVRAPSGTLVLRCGTDLPLLLEELSLPSDTLQAWPDPLQYYTPLGPAPPHPQRSRGRRRTNLPQPLQKPAD